MDAGTATDQLSNYYASAGTPVILIEQNYKLGFLGATRTNRFKAAITGSYSYPLNIVDSGHQVAQGDQSSYYTAYKAQIDEEMLRPPQAEITATFWRVGNHLEFEVNFTNKSGVTLSQTANDANVFVIVYEDVTPGLSSTGVSSRLARAVVYQPVVTPMMNDASGTFRLNTADLSGVDWSKLHSIAFVDYRTGGTTGPYDMLQAVVPVGPILNIQPASLSFTVDPDHLGDPSASLFITGTPSGTTWSVTSKPGWAAVTPSSGGVGSSATVNVSVAGLQSGINSGSIIITSNAVPAQTQTIPIQVNYTPPWFSVSPTSLNFSVEPGDLVNPQATIQTSGAPTSMQWSVTSKPAWVTVTPSTGTAGSSAVVTVSIIALQPGLNSGSIIITPESALAQAKTIPIQVTYTPPWLSVTPTSLSFTVGPVDIEDPQATLTINGTPEGAAWSVTSKPAWVTVTPASGMLNASAIVEIPVSGLQPGLNIGSIVITSQSTPARSQTISVQVQYTPPPVLEVTPTSLNFTVGPDDTVNPQATLTLNGYPAGTSWSVTSKPAWVTLSPSSGTLNSTALVTVLINGLQSGQNNGSITITAQSYPERSQTIPIQVSYTPPSVWLSVTPVSLSLIVGPDDEIDPQKTVDIVGSPLGTTWSVTSRPSWVTVTPNSGTVGMSAAVIVSISGLQPGQNSGTIVFTAQSNPVQTVEVPIQVYYTPAASLFVTPSSLSFVVHPDDLIDPQAILQVTGAPAGMSWSVESKPAWVSLIPETGLVGNSVLVTVSINGLQPGENHGSIVFVSQSTIPQNQTIPIQVNYLPPWFSVTPSSLNFTILPTNQIDPVKTLEITGEPSSLTWSIMAKPDWVSITPSSGAVGTPFQVRVEHLKLIEGDNAGEIVVQASQSGKQLTQTIVISAFRYRNFFLPAVWR